MEIKAKYAIGQKVWIVAENREHKEVEVFSDVISGIFINKKGETYYYLEELCEDVKEIDLILYKDKEMLWQKIIDIDNRLNPKEEDNAN